MEYPSYKTGGYYLSPTYEMPPEDKFEAIRNGMNYYNFDHVDPLLKQIEENTGNEEEYYDNNSVLHKTYKEPMSNYTRAHVGTTHTDGDHSYMHLDNDIQEDTDGYSYHDLSTFYDEKNYNNGYITSGPPGKGSLEISNEDILTNGPVRAGGMSQINMHNDIKEELLEDTNRNWYNIINKGYNLDLQNGAYGLPLSGTNEINNYDHNTLNSAKYERTGKHDVSPALLNWDFTYNTGSENFMASQTSGGTIDYGYRKHYFPGALSDSSLSKKSFISDIDIAKSKDTDIMQIPFEKNLWYDKMKLNTISDHILLNN